MSRRVFLLGLDGASWNVLDRLIAAGHMRNLDRLRREGFPATLESTVPPITPVAWLSLMTGCNPGRHGVYGFLKPSPGNSYLPLPVNRTDACVPTIFDYYRESGPLISLNLPMSWPASPINGCMVSCMMTPLHNPTDFEHPTGLLARFARAGIDYTIDPKFKARRGDDGDAMFTDWRAEGRAFVDLLAGITRNRMAAVRLLMDEEPWDAFVCVVVGTDRIQHLHFDRLLPEDGGDPDPMLAGYYRQVDEHLGELAGRLGRDDALLVVSDHGFVRTHGQFMTNEWLLREGWLEPRRARSSPFYPVKRLLGALGITRARLTPLIGEERSSRLQLAASHIDWGRSSAWLGSPFGIRLNVKGRETLGTVDPQSAGAVRDAIAARLADLTDEEGRPLIDSVRSRDDLYQGDALASAPDIVFTFRDDRNYGAYAGEIGHGLYQPTPFKTGDHRIDGVFLAWGGGIRAGAAPRRGAPEPRFQICDVLPTLLHLNGRAVPAVCDGRVRREILTEPGREPVRDPDWRRFLGEKRSVGYGSGQVDEVKERLRELGYLSDAD